MSRREEQRVNAINASDINRQYLKLLTNIRDSLGDISKEQEKLFDLAESCAFDVELFVGKLHRGELEYEHNQKPIINTTVSSCVHQSTCVHFGRT